MANRGNSIRPGVVSLPFRYARFEWFLPGTECLDSRGTSHEWTPATQFMTPMVSIGDCCLDLLEVPGCCTMVKNSRQPQRYWLVSTRVAETRRMQTTRRGVPDPQRQAARSKVFSVPGQVIVTADPCVKVTRSTRGQNGDEDAMNAKQRITPCLWFDDNAEEAVEFYVSIFDDSKILSVSHYGEAGPGPEGSVLSITFQLAGQAFMALNGGPAFEFTEAISLFVNCATQEEVDGLWTKLGAGGQEGACGWLKDKYGLSWQIVPAVLGEMLDDEDAEKANRVMQALLQMGKIDIQLLRQAYDNR